jgi:hypothetical protein
MMNRIRSRHMSQSQTFVTIDNDDELDHFFNSSSFLLVPFAHPNLYVTFSGVYLFLPYTSNIQE